MLALQPSVAHPFSFRLACERADLHCLCHQVLLQLHEHHHVWQAGRRESLSGPVQGSRMWGVEEVVSSGADVHGARGPRCLPGGEVEWAIGPLNMRPVRVVFVNPYYANLLCRAVPSPSSVTHVGNCLQNEADGNLIALNALAGIQRKSIIGVRTQYLTCSCSVNTALPESGR
ncbi:hypothetical protein B0H10DRAFT_2134675 [Mycena sp. CBHHK59/15]|nr:hypothetical protein B0H10DRAFT_2134675 [Mycena sp. CBHHK59/15]